MRRAEPCADLRHDARHLLVWLGIMGPQDGVDQLLDAMRVLVQDLERKDVHHLGARLRDCYDALREQCTELGLDSWVTFTGRADAHGRRLPVHRRWAVPDPKNSFTDVSTTRC